MVEQIRQAEKAMGQVFYGVSKQETTSITFRRSIFVTKDLKKGDVLVVKSIDRLGRNYDELLNQWRYITKVKGADIVVLDMPLLDTRHRKDLIGTLISDIVLQLLSYVAQTEREFIRQRQREGIDAAKARGVRFGRAPMERPSGYDAVCASWKRGEISAREAGRKLNITYKTFLRWARKEADNLDKAMDEKINKILGGK